MACILVVDDDDLVRESVVLALRGAKHVVSEASDGEQALEKLERAEVALVITDVLMPEGDGMGLILALRRQYPDIRIVCISGGDRTGRLNYLDMAQKLGAQAALSKPFTSKQLLAAVESALQMPVQRRIQDTGDGH